MYWLSALGHGRNTHYLISGARPKEWGWIVPGVRVKVKVMRSFCLFLFQTTVIEIFSPIYILLWDDLNGYILCQVTPTQSS